MNISNTIKDLRKTHHLSQEQLAYRIGVSRQAITKWETGLGMPDIQNICYLAKLFGITVDSLLAKSLVTGIENEKKLLKDYDGYETSDCFDLVNLCVSLNTKMNISICIPTQVKIRRKSVLS